jgi:hypothetical protein
MRDPPVDDPRLKKELMGNVAYKLPNKRKLSPRRLSDLALAIILITSAATVFAFIRC